MNSWCWFRVAAWHSIYTNCKLVNDQKSFFSSKSKDIPLEKITIKMWFLEILLIFLNILIWFMVQIKLWLQMRRWDTKTSLFMDQKCCSYKFACIQGMRQWDIKMPVFMVQIKLCLRIHWYYANEMLRH